VSFALSTELPTEDRNWLSRGDRGIAASDKSADWFTRVMAADLSQQDQESLLNEAFRTAGVGEGVMGATPQSDLHKRVAKYLVHSAWRASSANPNAESRDDQLSDGERLEIFMGVIAGPDQMDRAFEIMYPD
jgi:hypothetical protein